MQHNVSYFRQVCLTIPGIAGGNTGTTFTFLDQPDIRYARTTGFVALYANDLAYSQPNGNPVLPDSLAPKVTLVLQTNDPDDIVTKAGPKGDTKQKGEDGRFTGTLDTVQWLPLSLIHVNQSFGVAPPSFVRQMIHWKDRYIIWQKSSVLIAPGGLANTANIDIVLGVFYSFTNEKGTPIYPRN